MSIEVGDLVIRSKNLNTFAWTKFKNFCNAKDDHIFCVSYIKQNLLKLKGFNSFLKLENFKKIEEIDVKLEQWE